METVKETLDSLSVGGLKLLQGAKGYRYSLDPILLAAFVGTGSWRKVVDLGTGNGILPLLLARLTAAAELTGIEHQQSLVERARRNVALNSLQDRVTIVAGDIRRIRDFHPPGGAELVVTNPPYRRSGSGRLAPDDERAGARHELAGGLNDFVAAADWLLKQGGRVAMIHLAERLSELLVSLTAAGIEPKRLRLVHGRQLAPARLVLVEGRKGGGAGLQVEAPLYIYRNQGPERAYSEEILQFYQSGSV